MSAILEIKNICQAYGKNQILKNLSLKLEKGKIGCLLGPSASGKTTILRAIAGFEDLLDGEVLIDGQVMSRKGYTKPASMRGVGIVFQDYALFPHLTVRQNIAMGLQKLKNGEKKQRVEKWIDVVGLKPFGHRYPHELSGGQQQRVALARAMAPQPSLLLLDEPFSNLDVELRFHLSNEVRRILKENNMTALLVTHDQNEAFATSDEIGVFNDGKIEQWGSPYDLYHEPVNRFVADFIGQGTFIDGEIIKDNLVRTELGDLKLDQSSNLIGKNVSVLMRPDDVLHDDDSALMAEVASKAFRGAYILYTLKLKSGQKLLSYVPSHHNHDIGSDIGIRLEADHVIYFQK